MYEWLSEELNRIRWPGFHVIEPCRGTLDPNLPPSYLAFVSQFGAARLYRRGGRYQVGVYCPPEWTRLVQEDVLRIGYCTSNDAYFRTSELAEGREVPVYEMIDDELHDIAGNFASWLQTCAIDAREEYMKEDWVGLERGPEPFTPEEQSIVEARRNLSWKFLGAGPDNAFRFSVRNGSDRFVKALTIGVKARDGVVEARLPLDTSGIAPGEEQIVDAPGYATLPSEDAVAFDLPEPTPAERDRYAELATKGPMKR